MKKRLGHAADLLFRASAVVMIVGILVGAVLYRAVFIKELLAVPFFGIYSILVISYIISRFIIAQFYKPTGDMGMEPTVAIIVPAFNEEGVIKESVRSLLALNYPEEKLQIVAVNDGSTDNTLAGLREVEKEAAGRVKVISFDENRGKRAAMAAGIRATDAEILAFVDSDSVVLPDSMRAIVQDFHDPKVGAVCGHADVLNARDTWISRMQAVRYYVSFRVIKGAESVYDAVTCCSGCFSVYRREAVMPKIDWWENQSFLGIESSYGDDRSLTNCVLRDWKVRYQSRAVAATAVPDTFMQFMRQQARWKRSWTRESLIVSRFIWRKNPVAAFFTYVGILLPLVAPIVAIRFLIWLPLTQGAKPWIYILGLVAIALVYALYYALARGWNGMLWIYGVGFVFFYLVFILWQNYWAILTLRTRKWGTRQVEHNPAKQKAAAAAAAGTEGTLVSSPKPVATAATKSDTPTAAPDATTKPSPASLPVSMKLAEVSSSALRSSIAAEQALQENAAHLAEQGRHPALTWIDRSHVGLIYPEALPEQQAQRTQLQSILDCKPSGPMMAGVIATRVNDERMTNEYEMFMVCSAGNRRRISSALVREIGDKVEVGKWRPERALPHELAWAGSMTDQLVAA